jgi:hypothetical protein
MHDVPVLIDSINKLFNTRSQKSIFLARQLMLSKLPPSVFVEKYLFNNEGKLQDLTKFPMMKEIYNQLPHKLLLKCSRKTLKSTLLSNIICLNMIRWNYYKMLYVAPQETSTKNFSTSYITPRFDSPNLKSIFVKGWKTNDVYEKIFEDTQSSILFKYAKEDATRCRGPATDHNIHDEVQDMLFEVLPIISETMAMSPFKREFFAGTPLTTDNTINELWKVSTQLEWTTKCEGCSHWNMLTMDNNPLKMIRVEGYSCSRCGHLLDTTQGLWVSPLDNPSKYDLVGYHLAQPMLPHYNQNEKEWKKIYQKATNGMYGLHQVYNEVLGLAYDVGSKPISKEELKGLCKLGPMLGEHDRLNILESNGSKYIRHSTGVDWGVNMVTSRTAVVHGAIRHDGIFEVYFCKIYETHDHEEHIRDIAGYANRTQSIVTADGGPDPIRAKKLGELTSPRRMLIVRYTNGKLVQAYDYPKGAHDWSQNRYLLHRSDCLSFTFRMLKSGKILFPEYTEGSMVSKCMDDILSEFIEVKEGGLVQELMYSHAPNKPDDFLHALTFALVSAYSSIGDPILNGPSSTASDVPTSQ